MASKETGAGYNYWPVTCTQPSIRFYIHAQHAKVESNYCFIGMVYNIKNFIVMLHDHAWSSETLLKSETFSC